MKTRVWIVMISALVVMTLLSGCAGLGTQIKTSSTSEKLAWTADHAKRAYVLVEVVGALNNFAESPSARMVNRTKEYSDMLLAIQDLTEYVNSMQNTSSGLIDTAGSSDPVPVADKLPDIE